MGIESLFEPFTVRGLFVRSRFVMSPMSYYKNNGGVPNAEFADYHARRARTDVGLTITGATAVDRPAANNHPNLANINAETLEPWRAVVERVHDAGGPIALQIWHAGSWFRIAPTWRPAPLESPSGIEATGICVGEPMGPTAIEACIDAFGRAAHAACVLGFDAVEIHAAHGFLIDQFFWDVTNRREDKWGGSTLAERSRFAVEIVRAVRAAVDDTMPVFLRISQWKEQDYKARLAESPGELVDWLGPLVDAGVDVVHCSQRRFWLPEFAGSDLNLAGWVRRELGVPTVTVGSVGLDVDVMSFFDGALARPAPLDELVRRFERGDFDLVSVGRALLADPDWVSRVRAGEAGSMPPIDVKKLDLRARSI
jgi:2,4-dienoyl-CoA reductase-like NADH-dependent reductase (Old Yellow Enzyme family)